MVHHSFSRESSSSSTCGRSWESVCGFPHVPHGSGARAARSNLTALSISCRGRRERRRPGPLLIANTPGLLRIAAFTKSATPSLMPRSERFVQSLDDRGSRWSRTAIGYSSVNAAGDRWRSAGAVITETSTARRIVPGSSAGSRCDGPGRATSGPDVEPDCTLRASSPGGAGGPRK